MTYKMFDSTGSEIELRDLQDKGPWCADGASKEETFIAKYGKQFNLIINPEKADDIYAPDLFNQNTLARGDLKTQNTPFFQAFKRYGIDTQFAVTFNQKDFDRYTTKYPNIEIYFWVEWIATKFVQSSSSIHINPMTGIWYIPFQELTKLIPKAPLHEYVQRIHDTKGNAKGSFVLNLNDVGFKRIL